MDTHDIHEYIAATDLIVIFTIIMIHDDISSPPCVPPQPEDPYLSGDCFPGTTVVNSKVPWLTWLTQMKAKKQQTEPREIVAA